MEKRCIRKDCFGYAAGKKDCQVLTENVCLKRECSFFKTREEYLRGLYGDQAVAEKGNKKPIRGGKAVRCVETGQVFSSAAAAAEELGVLPRQVSAVCRGESKAVRGLQFVYVVGAEVYAKNAKADA